MRIAPLCSGTANYARTFSTSATGVDTGQRRTGITPRSGSRTACILAAACVVVRRQQPADPLVISKDQFNDVGRCAPCRCGRDWLALACSQPPAWDRGERERSAG
jgi:hypothetical protein